MNPREEEIIEISSPNRNPAATTGESSANINCGKYRKFFVWNAVLVLTFGLALLVDPLFLYVPILNKDIKCIRLDKKLTKVVLSLRSLTDMYYIHDFLFQLLAIREPHEAATLEVGIAMVGRSYASAMIIWLFPINIAPIPHVVILSFSKIIRGSRSTRMFLNFLVVLQYMARFLCFNHHRKNLEKILTKHTPELWIQGVFKFLIIKFWIRSAFIFFKFILVSHVFGALWYFFSFQREIDCWKFACRSENGCELGGFHCKDKDTFRNVTLLNNLCPANPPTATLFDFGIFVDAVQSGILSSTDFPQKFLRCFCSFGQNLQTSSYAWENLFAVFMSVIGMLLVLIYLNAILQMYFQLTTALSKEKERKKKRSPQIASWLDENNLPLDLKEKIVTFALQGLKDDEDVDIKNIHYILPWKDLVVIKRHLCLNTLYNVLMLRNLSEKWFEVLCEYLRPVIYKADTFIIREGEQFDKMLFITQGTVRTYTTTSDDGCGSSSTGNTVGDECFQKGDFYGDELLQAWASTKTTTYRSTKNVRCCTKVEGFTLTIKDMEISREKIRGEN
ncbi:cyclic nucleotide-gated ion channel 1-like [Pyrus ussuriensis x Pyrus communis]|uniref:Cyclic nucleotide-gated ion channel 1-like n=1 Tax=Pyrus ussuriensis x Pyrus communis TaxID=2448454 RepID=A0A5N5F7S0_9ROSA|nr:cyclic nucleotide-gated ion channel 1-like [Pyrus ussuriensis x Pyrus communis]